MKRLGLLVCGLILTVGCTTNKEGMKDGGPIGTVMELPEPKIIQAYLIEYNLPEMQKRILLDCTTPDEKEIIYNLNYGITLGNHRTIREKGEQSGYVLTITTHSYPEFRYFDIPIDTYRKISSDILNQTPGGGATFCKVLPRLTEIDYTIYLAWNGTGNATNSTSGWKQIKTGTLYEEDQYNLNGKTDLIFRADPGYPAERNFDDLREYMLNLERKYQYWQIQYWQITEAKI